MQTGTKKCILLLLAIIVLCFAVWLLWPHSFAEMTGIPAEHPDLNMAAVVTAAKFENGSPSFDIWDLPYCSAGSTAYEAVSSILSSVSYRQDLRNLLPGGLTSVGSDKDYDSRSVNLMFVFAIMLSCIPLYRRVQRKLDGVMGASAGRAGDDVHAVLTQAAERPRGRHGL